MKKKNRRRRRLNRNLIFPAAVLILVVMIFAATRLYSRWHKKDAGSGPAEGAVSFATNEVSEAEPAPGEYSTGEPAAEGTGTAAGGSDAGETGTAAGGSDAGETGTAAATPGAGETGTAAGTSATEEDKSAAGATEAPAYDHVRTELEQGKEYLSSLDERTPMEMEVMIDDARAKYAEKQRKAAYAAKREAYRETLDGEAVWDHFEDYVFLGDSRVVGFSLYGFLSSDRVLAHEGDTILAIGENLDSLRALAPKYIFVSYGINDVNIGLWPTAKEYADAFAEKLEVLQQAVPDAEIYVNSILPATESAVASAPVWGKLPEYSEAVSRMCAEKQISFIDNSAIAKEHSELFTWDGIHLEPSFYRYWGENQLLGIFDRANGELSFRN